MTGHIVFRCCTLQASTPTVWLVWRRELEGGMKLRSLIPPSTGKRVEPLLSQASTSDAALRPSLQNKCQNHLNDTLIDTHFMPQTISDWPLRQSPAANTPSTFVEYCLPGVWIFDRASCLTPSDLMTSFSGPRNPRARNTSWAGKNFSEPGTSSIFHRPPLSLVHSTRTVFNPLSLPSSSRTKSFVEMLYSRGSDEINLTFR